MRGRLNPFVFVMFRLSDTETPLVSNQWDTMTDMSSQVWARDMTTLEDPANLPNILEEGYACFVSVV